MDITQIGRVLGRNLTPFTDELGNNFVGGFVEMPCDNHSASDTTIHLNGLLDNVQQLVNLGTHSLARRYMQTGGVQFPEKWCVSIPEKGIAMRYEDEELRTEFVGPAHKHWAQDFLVFICIHLTESSSEELVAA